MELTTKFKANSEGKLSLDFCDELIIEDIFEN